MAYGVFVIYSLSLASVILMTQTVSASSSFPKPIFIPVLFHHPLHNLASQLIVTEA